MTTIKLDMPSGQVTLTGDGKALLEMLGTLLGRPEMPREVVHIPTVFGTVDGMPPQPTKWRLTTTGTPHVSGVVRKGTRGAQVLAAVRAGCVSWREIQNAIGGSDGVTGGAINRLIATGHLRRIATGRYALAGK